MGVVKTLTRSFAAGEITPELSDRVDLGQYQTGLAKCENAIVYPHGVVSKRGGTRFVCHAKNAWEDEGFVTGRNVRLIPFQFSATQSYVFELGHKYLRIHTEGGTVLNNENVTAEAIISNGVYTGSPNALIIKAKSHGLTSGAKIKLTAVPSEVQGNKVGELYDAGGGTVGIQNTALTVLWDAATGLPVAEGINNLDYFEIVDDLTVMGRPVKAGYLLQAGKSDPYTLAVSTAASISAGGTMTNTTHAFGTYAVGMYLYGTGVPSGVKITVVSGTGQTSGEAYTTAPTGTAVASTAITGRACAHDYWNLLTLEDWSVFDETICTVTVIDDDSFSIAETSTLTSEAPPAIAFTNITRSKEATVKFASAHGFSNDDIVYITINSTTKNPSTNYNFDVNARYKVSDATSTTFKIKQEVVTNEDTGDTDWVYVNTKKMMVNVVKVGGVKPNPTGYASAEEYKKDTDTAGAYYSVVVAATGSGTTLTLEGHGFYDGQMVWYAPQNILPFPRRDYYAVKVLDANTFELHEIGLGLSDAISVCDGDVAPIYELETPYDHEEVDGLDYAQSYDVLTLTHALYQPSKVQRVKSGRFEFFSEWFLPRVEMPTGLRSTISGNLGTKKRAIFYYVTAIRDGEESFASQLERPPRYVSRLKKVRYSPINHLVGTQWMNDYSSEFGAKTGIAVQISGSLLNYGQNLRLEVRDDESDAFIDAFEGAQSNSNVYRIVARMTGGYYILSRRNGEKVDWSGFVGNYANILDQGRINVYLSGSVSVDFTDAEKPAQVNLSWNASEGTEYNVYKRVGGAGGDTPGFIGRSQSGFFSDDGILPDMSITPPSGDDPFKDADDYPSSVDYYQQRKIYAGTLSRPQTTWMSRIGTENNMMQSLPVRDDDSINFRLAGREQNAIKFMVGLQSLVLFTENSEWIVSSVSGAALTPATIAVMQQSSVGCADVKPVVANSAILFVQAGSNRVMQMEYNFNAQAYTPEDVSMLAFHLFENHHIVSMVIERGIFPILWCVRDDGVLLGLTYAPKQNVIAWHRHDVGGEVKWATSTKEQSGVAVYLAVNRDGVMCIERMDNYSNWRDRSYFDALKTISVSRDSVFLPEPLP